MITVRVQGGLGNQLFQYAYGRALMHAGKDVIFDISFYESDHQYTKREYLLNNFRIGEVIKITKEYKEQNFLTRVINKLDIDRRVRYVPVDLNKDDYLADGYYVSEKYFSQIRDIMLQEITIKDEGELYKTWKAKILSSPAAVMIHARRTDHVANTTFTLINQEYYRKAITYFDEHAEIFGFSDDAEWFKGLFPNRSITVVSGNGLKDYEELMLMSLGKNFIIANSTYSWWGSWLSRAPDKKVVILKKWYRSILWWRANKDVEFAGWIRI